MFKGKGKGSVFAWFYLVAVLFFVWGVAAGNYKIFPWKQMEAVYGEVHAYFTFKDGATKSVKDKIVLDHQESQSMYDFSGFQLRDPSFQDTGYLLISEYSKKHSQVVVKLFSIADGVVLYTWVPPLSEIFKQAPGGTGTNTKNSYRAQHPLLLEDGGLVFTSGEGPMVRVNTCGEVVWVLNRHFHHSIELDHLGNIVVPIITKGNNSAGALPVRDDGYAIVSLDGEIIEEFSVTDILLKNGYQGLIYGVGQFESDRIHLNDAQPILKNIDGGQIGDVVLSSRHLSTVFLFQPQTGKVKWLKTGPWLAQHDVNQLDDGRYSIFGNDVVRQNDKSLVFIEDKGMSNVYVFNPDNNEVTLPYSQMMTEQQIATGTAGRSKILANGDVYIEESDRSRLIRVSKNTVRWEYVNSITPTTVGAVHWSRYIPENKIDLQWMENLTCD